MPVMARLKAFNGQYVCAEHGGGEALVADRDVPSNWETLLLFHAGATLRSGDAVALTVDNGMFVGVEPDGMVTATRSLPAAERVFTLVRADAGEGAISHGSQVALRTAAGKYLCAEHGGGEALVADREALSTWETFTLEIAGEGMPLRAQQGPEAVAPGRWLESRAALAPDGRLTVQHHAWTSNEGHGSAGGAAVFLIDLQRNIIAHTPLRSLRARGIWATGGPSAAVVMESDDLGAAVYQQTAKIVILHRDAPSASLTDAAAQGYYVGRPLADAVMDFLNNGR